MAVHIQGGEEIAQKGGESQTARSIRGATSTHGDHQPYREWGMERRLAMQYY